MPYHYIVLEGSHYEVGYQLASFLCQEPDAKKVYGSTEVNLKHVGFPDFDSLKAYCEECCPGVTDEIQGFADRLGISPQTLPFWNWTFGPSLGGGCTQFVVLSSTTKNQHIYAGRSYEWIHTDDDLKLITTRVHGKANHIGFSSLLFGRLDGFNEHGLVVSMSSQSIFGVPFKHRAPMFWLALRALLDQSTSVTTALELLETLPVTGYFTFMLVDRSDTAALIEIADGVSRVQHITAESAEPFGFSVNHYRQPRMIEFNKLNCGMLRHSQLREALIRKWFAQHGSNLTKQHVQELLAREHPKGLSNPFYNDGFGTLWSILFDITQGSVDVCFGAPTHNQYRRYDLTDPVGITQVPATIPISKTRLWPLQE